MSDRCSMAVALAVLGLAFDMSKGTSEVKPYKYAKPSYAGYVTSAITPSLRTIHTYLAGGTDRRGPAIHISTTYIL